jgi:hypothetical protein
VTTNTYRMTPADSQALAAFAANVPSMPPSSTFRVGPSRLHTHGSVRVSGALRHTGSRISICNSPTAFPRGLVRSRVAGRPFACMYCDTRHAWILLA